MNHKSNEKSRMRIAFSFLLVLCGLIMTAGASAQPVMTNNLSEQPSNATVLQAPTSNRIVLSTAGGKVRVLDSKGLLLESNMVYLPRINISDLSDSELHSLLETKAGYAALTAFGPINERTAQSAVIENQLRVIWLDGKSLAERIQTRLRLLDEMRAYNANLAHLPGLEMGASAAAARASLANERMAAKDQAATNAANGVDNAEYAHAAGDASRDQVHDAWSQYHDANESAIRADNRAIADNYRSAVASQSLQNYLYACAAISGDLAARHIKVPGEPPFYPVPPLSMKSEIDAERIAGKASTTRQ